MATVARHKAREQWTEWSGTPQRLSAIASEALALVGRDNTWAGELRVTVDASSWDSEYVSSEGLLAGFSAGDLSQIEKVDIEANGAEGRRIYVAISRPPKRSRGSDSRPPVLRLRVAGQDLHWVRASTEAMKETISLGAPRVQRVGQWLLYISAGIVAVGLLIAILSDRPGHRSTLETIGIGILIAGFSLLILVALAFAALPQLEIVPEGQASRAAQMLRWTRREGGWLLRTLIAGLVGSAITLLIQRLP